MAQNKSGKRIIAIAVSPKAYDEILTLKGERTWTKWLLELMSIENPTNEVLTDELLELVKAKTEKPKAEKSKKAKAKMSQAEAAAELREWDKVIGEPIIEPQPEIEYGKVNSRTGGTPIDISKIGKHEADNPGEESGELVLEK